MVVDVVRRCPADAGNTGRDAEHAEDLAAADGLLQAAGADREQEDDPEGERRLDDGERRLGEGDGLQRPAGQVEDDPEQPARPADQADEQGDPKGVLLRDLARLEGLERDAAAVESRRRAGREQAEDQVAH